jgi:signal peptidase II
MSRPSPNALPWLGLSGVLLVLDQWAKWLATTSLEYARPVAFIDGFWNWTLVHNYGAAFSFLSSAGGWQRWFFTVLALVISAGLAFWLARTPRGDWRTALPYALVIAGAIGNVIDRLRFGYVVDFVDWYVGEWHWPAFNVADACIVAGAIGLVIFSFREPAPAGKVG